MAQYPILDGCTCGWRPVPGDSFADHRCSPLQQANGQRDCANQLIVAVLLGHDHGRSSDTKALEDAREYVRIADALAAMPDPDVPRVWRPGDYPV